jgi:hypothetical protein
MAESAATKALKKELDKALRDLKNYKEQKPTIQRNIQTLIKNSKAGSPERKKYTDMYDAYKRKLKAWETKYKTYNSVADGALKAYQTSFQLDPLLKKQEDNKDLGIVDPKLQEKIAKLTDSLGSNYYTGTGTKANPFLQSGKPFTGEYNNRKYKDGIEVLTPTTPSGQTLVTSTQTPAQTPAQTPPSAGAGAGAGASAGAGAGTGVKEKTAAELETEALNVAAGQDFALPETLFKNIPSLNTLLKKYVDEKWTPDKLRKAIRDDLWFKQNSAEIKARYVQYYNYQDLLKSGQAKGSTDYEMQIAKIEANLKKRATEIGSAAASDPTALRKAAENLYITNRSEDTSFIDSFLAASIRPIAGTIGGKTTEGYSGQALSNYNLLVQAARDNGFQMSDIIPGGASEQQVLQGIAAGTIDVNRIIADSRKLAAQGQPQYVRDLLSQGYNLNQVYAPYRQTMATILDIRDPNQIDLNDPTLRAAITDKGDMNIYDFKKLLRRDDRWQYTEQAKEDVSTAALDVLRDFGFQG